MKFPGFIGGSYQDQSLNANASRSMNLYVETIETGDGKNNQLLLGTPGYSTFANFPTSPVRGVWAGEGRLFAVSGSKLYEVDSSGNIIGLGGPTDHTARGDVGNDGNPVQIFPNGNQIMIVSNGQVWVDNGNGPSAITFPAISGVCQVVFGTTVVWTSGATFDQTMIGRTMTIAGVGYVIAAVYSSTGLNLASAAPNGTGLAFSIPGGNVPARTGAFLDGYFIAGLPGTKQFNISKLNDGTTWNALDFAFKEGYPDNIAAIFADHEELYLFGTQTTEVWRNTGNAAFPLERDPGAMMHVGCSAPFSVARAPGGVAWIGGDARGGPVAYFTSQYQPQRVSTHAVEYAWSQFATVADAIAYTYEENGHFFWCISFPTGGANGATWVYDFTEKLWHERGWWNGSVIQRQRQTSHAFVFGKHIVGDYVGGMLYTQSLGTYTDNGVAIQRIRTAPHIADGNERVFFSRFRLDAETTNTAINPSLSWSGDGGKTFNTPRTTSSQNAGTYARYDWRRLGYGRDRVFSITISAASKIALIAAFLEV